MSKFFDDTMQGLLEAAALKKGNKTSKQDWIKLGYSNEETEELVLYMWRNYGRIK